MRCFAVLLTALTTMGVGAACTNSLDNELGGDDDGVSTQDDSDDDADDSTDDADDSTDDADDSTDDADDSTDDADDSTDDDAQTGGSGGGGNDTGGSSSGGTAAGGGGATSGGMTNGGTAGMETGGTAGTADGGTSGMANGGTAGMETGGSAGVAGGGGVTSGGSGGTACEPACSGRQCGDDGCNDVCGVCAADEECLSGQCECAPDCSAKECGDDGCGDVCGSCAGGEECDAGGQCVIKQYELETGTSSGAANVNNEGSGWTGTGFGDFGGSEGTWSISVNPGAGNYNLAVVSASIASRPVDIKVNGVTVTQHTFTSTGSWNSTWRTDVIPVTLNAGNNTIQFATVGKSGPNIDKLSFVPSVYSLKWEAEDYTAAECTGTKGGDGGTIVAYCVNNQTNSYTVNVPTAGRATFTFRITTNFANAQLQLLNASDTVIGQISVPATDWDVFENYSIKTSSLSAGSQTIKVRIIGDTTDMNWFALDR